MSDFDERMETSKKYFMRWLRTIGSPVLGFSFYRNATKEEDIKDKIDIWLKDKDNNIVSIQYRCVNANWNSWYNNKSCIYMRLYTASLNPSELFNMKAKYFIYISINQENIEKWCVIDVPEFQHNLNIEYRVPSIEEIKENNGTMLDDPEKAIEGSFDFIPYRLKTKAVPTEKKVVDYNTFVRIPISDYNIYKWSLDKNIPKALFAQMGFSS